MIPYLTNNVRGDKKVLLTPTIKLIATLIDNSSDAILARNPDKKIISWNKGAEALLGYTKEEALGKTASQLGMIHFTEAEMKELDESLARTGSWVAEKEYFHKNGGRLVGTVSANIISYGSVTNQSALFIIKDITQQKKLENERRKTIMDSALEAIVGINDLGNITFWNKNAEKLFGWQEEQIIGKKVSETIIPHKYREQHLAGLKKYKETFHGPILNKLVEMTALTKDCNEIPVEMSIVPIKGQEDLSFCAFFRDITERKAVIEETQRNEKRMKRAQEIAHLGNWEIDLKTGIAHWSDEAGRIYGIRTANGGIIDKDWLEMVHPDDRERLIAENEKGKLGWKGASYYHRIVRDDGSIRHLYSESRYEFDHDGNPVILYGISHDITALKKLEEELQEQQRKEQLKLIEVSLKAQEKERTAIGQELHDNVNQILVGTKLLLSSIKPRTSKCRETLATSLDYLQNAINENRRISHELVSPSFEKATLAEKIAVLADTMLKSVGIQATVESEGYTDNCITNDLKVSLYRVIQEQSANIIKYSGARTVKIYIGLSNKSLKLSITDDGRGTDLQKLYDGIGLQNIKSRMSIYHGEVDITTSPGKGFSLAVTIPQSYCNG